MSDLDAPIINRVAASGLISLDLEDFYPAGPITEYDLAQNLFQGLILREKDFRQFLAEHDWTQYQGHFISLHCSADAIIPSWAWMLLTLHLEPYAAFIAYGSTEDLLQAWYRDQVNAIDLTPYHGARIVIKGCSDRPVPLSAYVHLTARLRPLAASLMFGEPCSTVPLYKKPKAPRA